MTLAIATTRETLAIEADLPWRIEHDEYVFYAGGQVTGRVKRKELLKISYWTRR